MVTSEPRKKSQATPPAIDPGTVRLVAQCLNHYATPGPTITTVHANVNCFSDINLLTGHDVYVRSRIALFQWL